MSQDTRLSRGSLTRNVFWTVEATSIQKPSIGKAGDGGEGSVQTIWVYLNPRAWIVRKLVTFVPADFTVEVARGFFYKCAWIVETVRVEFPLIFRNAEEHKKT